MESEGALTLFKQSQKKLGLTCKINIGDRDSKSYAAVSKAMPYEFLVHIVKKEFVLCITKRMGTGLREIAKQYKGNFNISVYAFSCTVV